MDVIMYIYIYIHLCLKYILYSIVWLASYLTVYNYMGPPKKKIRDMFLPVSVLFGGYYYEMA